MSAATYVLVARAVPDDGSRRLDGEGLRPDPRGPRADRPESSWRRRSSPSRAATPPPPSSCVSTSAIPRSSRWPSTRSPRPCSRDRPISACSSTKGRSRISRWGWSRCSTWARSGQRETGLPLPLGINVMRRDLGEAIHRALSQALRDSIDYAYANVDEALEYAMRYGRGHRQGDLPAVRPHVRERLHEATGSATGKAALERLYRARPLEEADPHVLVDPCSCLTRRGRGRAASGRRAGGRFGSALAGLH